jgi:hypothetical protein
MAIAQGEADMSRLERIGDFKKLQAMACAGKVSRRSFMEGALALGAGLSAAGKFWSSEARAER